MASATPNGPFHQARLPECLSHMVFEKSVPYANSPKVADAVIKA